MEREELTKCIGINIKKYRLQKDFSQESLALSAGIHPAYLGRLERGEKCPTIDTLYKICDALKISVSELLNFKESNAPDYCIKSKAKDRIETALVRLPESKCIKMAEIIENMIDIFVE